MITYRTSFEATRNIPETINIGHGENADLSFTVTDGGIPVELAGYTVKAIYQPKSKWQTRDFYECPSEIVQNTAIVHWGHLYDNGDDAVKMWVRFEKNGKVSYPALYAISLFYTPGFDPSAITPIPEVIDFNVISYRNAPWLVMNPSENSSIVWNNDKLNLTASNGMSFIADDIDVLASYGSIIIDGAVIKLIQGFGSVEDDEGNNLLLTLNGKESTGNKTNVLSSTSTNAKYPSAKAVVDYVNSIVGSIGTVLDSINGEVI